jgi:hypothetical protein
MSDDHPSNDQNRNTPSITGSYASYMAKVAEYGIHRDKNGNWTNASSSDDKKVEDNQKVHHRPHPPGPIARPARKLEIPGKEIGAIQRPGESRADYLARRANTPDDREPRISEPRLRIAEENNTYRSRTPSSIGTPLPSPSYPPASYSSGSSPQASGSSYETNSEGRSSTPYLSAPSSESSQANYTSSSSQGQPSSERRAYYGGSSYYNSSGS